MLLALHEVRIWLQSDDASLNGAWRQLFAGWLAPGPTGNAPADISLELALVRALPSLPAGRPIFTDDRPAAGGAGLGVYRDEGQVVWLHYPDEALVKVSPGSEPGAPGIATGTVTPGILSSGRLEDLTFTALAPLLRRRGYYLIHAFAAARDGRAALIVGPSCSGKTTTGLSLLLDGWHLLGNDVVLLREGPDGIYALPTPGTIHVRPPTFDLLPQIRSLPGGASIPPLLCLPVQKIASHRQMAPLVTAVYFPRIVSQFDPKRQRLNSAIGLARLLEASIDRWDEVALAAHVDLLARLSTQAIAYQLHLGTNVAYLPRLF